MAFMFIFCLILLCIVRQMLCVCMRSFCKALHSKAVFLRSLFQGLVTCKDLHFLTAHSLSTPGGGLHSRHSTASPLMISAFWPLLWGEERRWEWRRGKEEAWPRDGLSGRSSGNRMCRKMEWNTRQEGKAHCAIQGNGQWAGEGHTAESLEVPGQPAGRVG